MDKVQLIEYDYSYFFISSSCRRQFVLLLSYILPVFGRHWNFCYGQQIIRGGSISVPNLQSQAYLFIVWVWTWQKRGRERDSTVFGVGYRILHYNGFRERDRPSLASHYFSILDYSFIHESNVNIYGKSPLFAREQSISERRTPRGCTLLVLTSGPL